LDYFDEINQLFFDFDDDIIDIESILIFVSDWFYNNANNINNLIINNMHIKKKFTPLFKQFIKKILLNKYLNKILFKNSHSCDFNIIDYINLNIEFPNKCIILKNITSTLNEFEYAINMIKQHGYYCIKNIGFNSNYLLHNDYAKTISRNYFVIYDSLEYKCENYYLLNERYKKFGC